MVAQNIFFYAFAAAIVFGAFRVVTARNVVHSAVYLVVVLASVGAQYILLAAEFGAATQVLVYIGAIVVLFLFGIMLTRSRIGADQELTNRRTIVSGAATALFLLGVMGYALIDEYGWTKTTLPHDTQLHAVNASNTQTVSDSIFSTFLLPFEAISVLLLAALVGAIVLARKD
jgi:NADH-quinone oxidoreductase subunit J